MAQRMTEEQSEKTWRYARISWYVSVSIAVFCFVLALMRYSEYTYILRMGSRPEGLNADLLYAMLYTTWGLVFLIGAGIIRLQSRIEGQHTEIARLIRNMGSSRAEKAEQSPKTE